MTERPILFSAPMVRAILAGQKTQTRRLVQIPRRGAFALVDYDGDGWWPYQSDDGESHVCHDGNERPMSCPFGTAGDRLWVKETIRHDGQWSDGIRLRDVAVYAADNAKTKLDTWPWKRHVLQSIYCPRGLSRITLEVAGVRVERLHALSEGDARAEGVQPLDINPEQPVIGVPYTFGQRPCSASFACLWDEINEMRAPWSSNPWVWVVSFKRVEAA